MSAVPVARTLVKLLNPPTSTAAISHAMTDAATAAATATRKSTSDDPSLITTPLLQHRLAVGLGIAGGARGSLNRCAVQLAVLGATKDTNATSDAATSLLLTDLSLQQIEMTKLILQVQRNAQELQKFQTSATAMETTTTDSAGTDDSNNNALRHQLQRQQQVRSCLHEYEALAAVTVSHHVTAQGTLQHEMDALHEQHTAAHTELQTATKACRIRASQFHLLQQCIQDMKHSLDTTNPLARDAVPRSAKEAISTRHDTSDVTEMDIENDEGELYGDL